MFLILFELGIFKYLCTMIGLEEIFYIGFGSGSVLKRWSEVEQKEKKYWDDVH